MNEYPELKSLGERLRDIRTAAKMTQQEVASRCGMERNYISMLERGERNPTYITLVKLAKGYGKTLRSLLG